MTENELLIVSTQGPEAPEKLLMPFIIANASLALDIPVTVFLMSSAVELVIIGRAEEVPTLSGMPELPSLIKSFFEQGGIIKLCGPCCNHRNITEVNLIDGASVGGAAGLVDLVMNRKVLSF